MLKLRFLGPLEMQWGLELLKLSTRKSALLLAYLIIFRDRAHPRGTLAGLFWGEASEQRANISLRNALTALRKALPISQDNGPYLISMGGSLRFNDKAPFELDTLTLETTLRLAREQDPLQQELAQALQAALALYRGPFLEGLL